MRDEDIKEFLRFEDDGELFYWFNSEKNKNCWDRHFGKLGDYIRDLQEELKNYKFMFQNLEKVIKEEGCYDEEMKTFCDDINHSELPKLLAMLDKVKENK